MERRKQEMSSGAGLMTTVGHMAVYAREVPAVPAGGWRTQETIDGGALSCRGLVEQDA
jgi:hypothetical protein